ncbi:T7SS effector LXG polymorphic toxin [Bacillus mycoides]|nr:T7SS effector LXG polymorphic toxin [Bacillus mycoides]
MGFHVDLKEFHEVLEKLQKDTSKTNNQLEQAKQALNGIIQADAMQGATGKAIVNDINNNQNTVVIGLKDTNELLSIEMAQTLQDFQSTTGETDENAVILEDALLQAQNKLSNLQPKKHELDSRISNIYNSVSDLISLSMPNSQFDEKLVAASKELEDTIQKVQQFESKKEKSNAENTLDALNKQVQIAGKMGSLSYTDPQLQAFFALDDLAKGIHEMDTQITKAKKEAQLQAEREMKKKQEEWAEHHPVEAWLQNFSSSAGEKWDVLRKGTKWVGENIPFLKGLADDALVLEGFLGAAGSAISGIAIGATKLGSLVLELGEWGFNSIRGVETEQWKLDDIYGAGNTIKSLGQAIISWQDYPKYGKALVNSVKGYVEKALTDPYALGGAIFDIGSCFVGVGEVTAAVKGSAAFGKLAEGAKVFQVAEKSGKIVGKLEEVAAFMNKLPGRMKNVVEKIKNIEIPNLSPKPSLAGVGNVGEGNTLGRELFSVAKSETKGQAQNANRLSGEKFDNLSLNIEKKTSVGNEPVFEKKPAQFLDGLNLKSGQKVPPEGLSNAELNTSDSVKKFINNSGYSVDEFVGLLHPDRVLNASEKTVVDNIRNEIGVPDVGTKMKKVIPQSDIYKYLYDENYTGVRGFTAVDEHSANLKTLFENYEGARLDYDGTMFKVDHGGNGVSTPIGAPDRFYGAIEYIENDPSKLTIPRWEANVDNYPFTARGFTGSKNIVLPEFSYERGYARAFQDGDILNIIDSETGNVATKFEFNKKFGWTPEGLSNAELNTSDSVKNLINNSGYSVDEFVELLHPDRVLNANEKTVVDNIRNEIGVPDVGTKMKKVIPQSDIYKYLYDENYTGVRGFTAVDEHSANLKTLFENYEGARLDYDGTMFKVDHGGNGVSTPIGAPDKFYGAIEYIENDPSKLTIPRWEANADNYPFTARGFTGSKNIALPEFSYERGYARAFQDGDILNIIDSETGNVATKFEFNKKIGWVMTD